MCLCVCARVCICVCVCVCVYVVCVCVWYVCVCIYMCLCVCVCVVCMCVHVYLCVCVCVWPHHATCGNLSYLTRNQTHASCTGSRVLTTGPPGELLCVEFVFCNFAEFFYWFQQRERESVCVCVCVYNLQDFLHIGSYYLQTEIILLLCPFECPFFLLSCLITLSRASSTMLPCPAPGDLPDPGIKPTFPALAGKFFTTSDTQEATMLN